MMFLVAAAATFLLLAGTVAGQIPEAAPRAAPGATSAPSDPLGRLTPYGCVIGFLRAADAGDYSRAAAYLDTGSLRADPEDLARKLKEVLDVGLRGTLDGLSRSPDGDLTDGLNPNRERAGLIQTSSGKIDIVLNRTDPQDGPPIWLFSRASLRSIPKAYDELGTPPGMKFFPEKLREIRVFGIPLWRYVVAFVGLAVTIVTAFLITRLLIFLLRLCLSRVTGEEFKSLLSLIRNPLRLILSAVTARILSSLSPSLLNRQFWNNVADILGVIGVAWLAMNLGDVVSEVYARRLLRRQKPDRIAILALARRLFKIVVVLIAVTLLLRRGGVNFTTLLAGLGVGGVALALAAQKTLENVFGGISLIMREAVRVGDTCRIVDQTGIVEDIGMASTRLRTFDRTVVSVPNAQLSLVNLENYSLRDKFWIHQIFRLRTDTTAEQMQNVLTGIEEVVKQEKMIEAQSSRVRFIGIGQASLQLEVFAYVLGTDYLGFLRVQQEFLLRAIQVVAASGTALATAITQIDAPS